MSFESDLLRALNGDFPAGPMSNEPIDEDDLVEAITGENPMEAARRAHYRQVLDMGSRDSATAIVRPDGGVVTILGKGKGKEHRPHGKNELYRGFAGIQVNVTDFADAITPVPSVLIDFNQRLILTVSWQTATSGGECEVDASQGTTFALGGSHAIQMSARILSTDSEGPITNPDLQGPALKVEAVILWDSPINPKAPYMTRARQTLDGLVPSPLIRVPQHANTMLATSTVPGSNASLLAEFACNDIAAGPTIQSRTLNPFANGSLITSSHRFVRFDNNVAMIVTPIFELSI